MIHISNGKDMKNRGLIFICVFLLIFPSIQQGEIPEQKLKAIILLRLVLASFENTTDTVSSIHLYLLAANSLSSEVRSLISSVDEFKRIKLGVLDPTRPCPPRSVLFYSSDYKGPQKEWNALLTNSPCLIISDDPNFFKKYAMIYLYIDENRTIGFDVHLKRLKEAQIELSSRILRLAREVYE